VRHQTVPVLVPVLVFAGFWFLVFRARGNSRQDAPLRPQFPLQFPPPAPVSPGATRPQLFRPREKVAPGTTRPSFPGPVDQGQFGQEWPLTGCLALVAHPAFQLEDDAHDLHS